MLRPRPHSLATQYSLRLSRVCGRSSKEESFPLFVLFVLFGQAKSTLCCMYFCMTKSTKSHLRGSLLEISLSFPALPTRKHHIPSCANISSEPSAHRQRQKCRLKCTGCLLDFALCHADIRRGSCLAKARSAPRLCQRTDFMHARHFFYAGVEPAHTRICSATSCDVFARVV